MNRQERTSRLLAVHRLRKELELQRLGDFDLADPRVQKKLRERYGDRVPLDEPVISPASIADSPLLVTVAER